MAHEDVVQESGSDIDNAMLIGIGLATTFAVVAIVYFVQALDQDMNHSVETDRQRRGADYVAYQTEQEQKFAGDYRWADDQKKLVAIPKEDAKKMVAKALPQWAPPPAPVKPAPAPAPAPEKKDEEKEDEDEKKDEDEKGTEAPAPAPEAPAPVPVAPKAPVPAAPKAPVPAAPKAPAPAAPKAPAPGGI